MNPSGLKDRHALVSGAARGIGAAIAQRLAQEGARLTLLGRSAEALEGLRDRLPEPDRHGVVVADVTDAEALGRAFAEARAARGPVTVLVNNAGQAASAPFLKTDAETWRRMWAVNVEGVVNGTREALPDMLAAGWGRVVNIASTAGLKGYAYVAAYTAAKHAVVGLTRSLALEYAKRGITVNAVCPGYTETEILRASVANVVGKTGRSEAEARASFEAVNPQGRIVQPQEVADAVAWLCGEGAASINGQSIAVAGGEVT